MHHLIVFVLAILITCCSLPFSLNVQSIVLHESITSHAGNLIHQNSVQYHCNIQAAITEYLTV